VQPRAPTIAAVQPDDLEAVGTSEIAERAASVARSGSVVALRVTLPGVEQPLREAWELRGSAEGGKSGFPGRALEALPRRGHIVTEYEPHLRQRTVGRLCGLSGQLRDTLGQPETATIQYELSLFMAEVYREAVRDPQTRNLATAVSLLQDFLHPHWSTISLEKLNAVAEILGWLREQTTLTPRALEILQEKLSGTLGGFSIESYGDEPQSSEASDES
jgi:hypothetical protein